jgi:hypothetical protein
VPIIDRRHYAYTSPVAVIGELGPECFKEKIPGDLGLWRAYRMKDVPLSIEEDSFASDYT